MNTRKKDTPGKFSVFVFISLLVVVIDQITKFFLREKTYPLLGKVFSITYIQNTGASFGILKDMTAALIFFSVFVIGLILFFYDKTPKKLMPFAALILGGTTGNLIDRIMLGHVHDFIKIWLWPAFNIADLAITVGVIYLVVYLLSRKK